MATIPTKTSMPNRPVDDIHGDARYDPAPAKPQHIETSVRAHMVLSVALTMSTSEMDALMGVLRRAYDRERFDWTPTERAIVEETLNAIESVR